MKSLLPCAVLPPSVNSLRKKFGRFVFCILQSYILCVFAADAVILDDTEVLVLGWPGLRSVQSSCYCFSLIPDNSHLLVYTDERLEGGAGTGEGYHQHPNGHEDDAGEYIGGQGGPGHDHHQQNKQERVSKQ